MANHMTYSGVEYSDRRSKVSVNDDADKVLIDILEVHGTYNKCGKFVSVLN
jgi:hypothetical protein